jgi:pimeloyl-ACP methyl ester carboxylesterase
MRQREVTVQGGRLSVADEGDGPTILLLHASIPHATIVEARAWEPLVPHLVAAGWRAVRFDVRGYGQSATEAGLPWTRPSNSRSASPRS